VALEEAVGPVEQEVAEAVLEQVAQREAEGAEE